jgi:hypothetical protein
VTSGFYLSVLIGPGIPLPAPASVIDSLVSAQVTTAAGQRSGFQMSFAAGKSSLITTTLVPAGYFDPGMRVILTAVVGGFPTVLIDGVITRQDVTASNEVGQPTLSVTGEDVSVVMDFAYERTPYPGMTADTRVRLILLKYFIYGLIPLVIPPLFPNFKVPTKQIPLQAGTDLEYINLLAHRNGYTFYIECGPVPGANIAYWGPEIRLGLPQPALTINMDAASNVESLSFGFDGLAGKQHRLTITEPTTHLPIPIPIPDINILAPPLSLKPATKLRSGPVLPAAKEDPIEAAARALAAGFETSDAVTGSGQLDVLRYGRILRARHLVGVRGAGIAYDGLYYVKSVTHNIKRGEYKQSFSLSRNGLIPLTPAVIP